MVEVRGLRGEKNIVWTPGMTFEKAVRHQIHEEWVPSWLGLKTLEVVSGDVAMKKCWVVARRVGFHIC